MDSDTAVAFTLTVTDDDGATGSLTYEVTINNVVANQPPTVTGITGDTTINEGASGTLTGGRATDGDGTVSSYSWSVNNTSAATITTGNAATLQYTALPVDSVHRGSRHLRLTRAPTYRGWSQSSLAQNS